MHAWLEMLYVGGSSNGGIAAVGNGFCAERAYAANSSIRATGARAGPDNAPRTNARPNDWRRPRIRRTWTTCAWDSARGSAWASARECAWNLPRGSARGSARGLLSAPRSWPARAGLCGNGSIHGSDHAGAALRICTTAHRA